MSLAIFRVMMLGVVRDRGTLAMAFALPPLNYMIFASIFAGAAGDELRLRVALFDQVNSPVTQRLVAAIRKEPTLRRTLREPSSIADVEAQVAGDDADVGVVIRSDPAEISKDSPLPPIIIFGDAAKAMASPLAAGQIQRIFSEKLPDAAYRRVLTDFERVVSPLSPQQRTRADGILDFIGRSTADNAAANLKEAVAARATPALVENRTIGTSNRAKPTVVYYAGAVAILFLLYSAMHGAMSLIEERHNGIIDRVLQGAGGVGSVLGGKFLFLLLQGIVQVGLIFAVAAAFYGVVIGNKFGLWLAITVAASAAAAGLGLALCTAARTRQQAQTLSTFLVLMLSALGGSMVPRFLMPPWLQQISWGIPNAWVIESYHGLLWRDATAADLVLPVGLLLAFSALTLTTAWVLLWRDQRA